MAKRQAFRWQERDPTTIKPGPIISIPIDKLATERPKPKVRYPNAGMTVRQSRYVESLCAKHGLRFDPHISRGEAADLIEELRVKPVSLSRLESAITNRHMETVAKTQGAENCGACGRLRAPDELLEIPGADCKVCIDEESCLDAQE